MHFIQTYLNDLEGLTNYQNDVKLIFKNLNLKAWSIIYKNDLIICKMIRVTNPSE